LPQGTALWHSAVAVTKTDVEEPSRPSQHDACPACRASGVARTVVVHESMFGSAEAFRYAECHTCGSLRLTRIPADLGKYYPRSYYSVNEDPQRLLGRPPVRQVLALLGRSTFRSRGVLAAAARRTIPRRQVQTLLSIYASIARAGLQRGRDSRILDVGAGSGMLVYALSLAGFRDVLGVDPFAERDRVFDTGARLEAAVLGAVGEDDWDLVMFHHSFEHLPDPESELLLAASRLAPDGRILIRMPTVSSWAWGHYGPDWVQLDAPRHLAVFSRDGMARLATRCGLRVIDMWDDSTSFQFWGSEQVRRGIALNDPTSHMVAERRSLFSRRQLARWTVDAARLNGRHEGDQAAWVVAPE
jgi:SAM-dependent methyltransferase